MAKIKRLFFDLETSPNIGFFWRAGYDQTIPHDNIIQERAIICACWKWEGARGVESVEWRKGNDKQIVKTLLPILNEADEIIAHNGDRFDVRWFNTRCLVHGLDGRGDWRTVDTLKLARRKFMFNSNRLDYLGKLLLGEGKRETGGFRLWRDIVLKNCPKAMAKMVRYCKRDVVLLERVWSELRQYDKAKTHAGELAGNGRWSCPHCASEDVKKYKNKISAAGIRSYGMQCKTCGRYYSVSDCVARAYVEAKQGGMKEAC